MMLDRMEGNAELKTSVQQMLATRRLTHSEIGRASCRERV